MIESLENFVNTNIIDSAYKIGKGDQISILFGASDIFPSLLQIQIKLRRVDSKHIIFLCWFSKSL